MLGHPVAIVSVGVIAGLLLVSGLGRRPCLLLEARPVIALVALKGPAVTLAAGVGIHVSLRV